MTLSLDQYARVVTALELLGLPQADVLAAECISLAEWESLKAPLEARLEGAALDDDFLEEYVAASQRALMHFRRRVAPLDRDPLAWFAFLKCFGESANPSRLARELGLTEIDLANLGAYWVGALPGLAPRLRIRAAEVPPRVPKLRLGLQVYPTPADPIGIAR
ncbi:MAG: hypothetical protein R3B07_23245 [Polyangiaceae bacterium]